MWAILAAWAWLLVPAAAAAGDFHLASLTGTVQIVKAGELSTATARSLLPLRVAPGSRVTVLSGRAAFEARHLCVEAFAGDSFTVSEVTDGGVAVGTLLWGSPPATSLSVDVEGTLTVVYEGSALSVVDAPGGAVELQARAGFLTLSDPNGDRVLAPGDVLTLRPTGNAAEGLAIVGPDEVLRSAVGPKHRPGTCGRGGMSR